MTDKDTKSSQASSQAPTPEVRDQNSRPWRTEVVPKEQPPKRRPDERSCSDSLHGVQGASHR